MILKNKNLKIYSVKTDDRYFNNDIINLMICDLRFDDKIFIIHKIKDVFQFEFNNLNGHMFNNDELKEIAYISDLLTNNYKSLIWIEETLN